MIRSCRADSTIPELNKAFGDWAVAHIEGAHGFAWPYSTLGVFLGDELIAVIVYNNFDKDSGVLEMHGAATNRRWLSRPVLFEMFDFPLNRLGCQMVVMRVSEKNEYLRRILTRYGFKSQFIPRLRGRDEGEYIMTLTDDDWQGNGYHKADIDGTHT